MRNQIRHKFISLMKSSSSKLRFLTLKLDLKSVGLPPKRWIFTFVFMSLFLIFAFQNCKSGTLSSPSLYDKASTELEPTPEGGVPNNKGDSRTTTTTTEGGVPGNRGDSRASTTTTTEGGVPGNTVNSGTSTTTTTTTTKTTTTTTLLDLFCENRDIDPRKASKSGPNLTYRACEDGEKCVDILFVVDNSISMLPLYDRLAYQFSTLETELQNVNWQIAIINSNSNPKRKTGNPGDGYEGTFYHLENQYGDIKYNSENVKILTPELGNYFNLENIFLNTVKCADHQRTNNNLEYHFASILYATQLYDSTHNDFFRDDADFVVILFTDEGDHGKETYWSLWRDSRIELISEVKGLLGTNKHFVVHGIFHKEESCKKHAMLTNDADSPSWSHKIEEVINNTNGIQKNICDEDHTEHLRSIGQAIKGQNQ